MNYKQNFYKHIKTDMQNIWVKNMDLQSQYFNKNEKRLKFLNLISFIGMLFFYAYLFMVLTFQRSNIMYLERPEYLSSNSNYTYVVIGIIIALNVYFVLRRMNFVKAQIILSAIIIVFSVPNLISMLNFDQSINQELAGVTLANTSDQFIYILVLYIIMTLLFLVTNTFTFKFYLKKRKFINAEFDKKYNALYKKSLLKNGGAALTDQQWDDDLAAYLKAKYPNDY